jgi:Ca2+-binding RTX toxin-like protein
MRFGGVLAAMAAVLVPSLSLAADRVCTNIALLSPAYGQHFIGTRPIHFSWSGEPVGTATRELRLASLDGAEVVLPLDGRFSDTLKVKMTGDLGWAVVFRDGDGTVLCVSPAGLIAAGAGGGSLDGAPATSLSSSVAGTPAVFMRNGRLVIVLQNSPYTGPYTRLIASDNYDGTGEDLMGAIGVELYANNANNTVRGTNGNDIIHLYAGTDTTNGGPGNDDTYMGSGTKSFSDPAGNDVDRYFLKATVTLGLGTATLEDGDASDKIFYELGAQGGFGNDPGEELADVVPFVPD